MFTRSSLHRGLLGIAGALAIGALSMGGAIAAPVSSSTASVTQQITGGTLTASIGSGSLNTISYSNFAQVTTGSVHMDVVDATGSSSGWNVAVSSSPFVFVGTSTIGIDIPAANFSITTAGAPSFVAGQPIDSAPLHGPTAGVGGSLDSARTTISAHASYGSGSYGQNLGLSLNVPALSQAGTYTATLTVAISVGP